MTKSRKGILVFIAVIILAVVIGSYILTATFFGIITLIGLIALIESIQPIKWLAERSTSLIDVIIFVFSIFATMNYGLNITASLTIAGLGYTLVYAPYLRENRTDTVKTQKNRPVYRQVNRQ